MIKALAILMFPRTEYVLADATGRSITIPDRIQRVVPAGPSAAVLPLAFAPVLMIVWPSPVSDTPPSINRLLGLVWLDGDDPETQAVTFNVVFCDHVLTAEQRGTVLTGIQPA